MREISISQPWEADTDAKPFARIHLCFNGANLWILSNFYLKWFQAKQGKHQISVQKKKVEDFFFSMFGKGKEFGFWQVKSPVISKHCVMHVCADTQKTDWTRPPVPDTALHVCHGLLAQIHDRTPQSFQNPWLECVCVCLYCEWEGEGCPGVWTLMSCRWQLLMQY